MSYDQIADVPSWHRLALDIKVVWAANTKPIQIPNNTISMHRCAKKSWPRHRTALDIKASHLRIKLYSDFVPVGNLYKAQVSKSK